MPLTDVAVRNAKPKDKPYKMGDSGGLFLLVVPRGARWWRLSYRFGGKQKTLSCGVYPEVGLVEAYPLRVTNGVFPGIEQRRPAKAVSKPDSTGRTGENPRGVAR